VFDSIAVGRICRWKIDTENRQNATMDDPT
jgi:hypothetical protein